MDEQPGQMDPMDAMLAAQMERLHAAQYGRKRRGGRNLWVAVGLLIVMLVLLIGGLIWLSDRVNQTPSGGSGSSMPAFAVSAGFSGR